MSKQTSKSISGSANTLASNLNKRDFYSIYRNPKLLQQGNRELLENNSESLIKYIYDPKHHQGILGHPEVRIGIVIKLLNNLNRRFNETLLKPILDDIDRLMESEEYLESTGNVELRKKCLGEEYNFIQKYIDVDDNMTLNSEMRKPLASEVPNSTPNQAQTQNQTQTKNTTKASEIGNATAKNKAEQTEKPNQNQNQNQSQNPKLPADTQTNRTKNPQQPPQQSQAKDEDESSVGMPNKSTTMSNLFNQQTLAGDRDDYEKQGCMMM